MIGVVTSLTAACDPGLWNGALRRASAHFTPLYGKDLTRELVGRAARRAFPSGGEEPWDYASGVAIDDYLNRLIAKLRRLHRPRPGNLGTKMLEQPVADIRDRFAADPEALGVFEATLRKTSGEPLAEPPLSVHVRSRAILRLWRYAGTWSERLTDVALSVRVSLKNGRSEKHLLEGALLTLEKEDAKCVRTLDEGDLDEELRDQGWQPSEIRAMVQEALAKKSSVREPMVASEVVTESARPIPPVVPYEPRQRRAAPSKTRGAMITMAVAALLLLMVWAKRSGHLDSATSVARLTNVNTNKTSAAELREKASRDCAAARSKECLEELDQAKEIDPDGDRESEVAVERKKAELLLLSDAEASSVTN
jgi:hypothetical protein